MSAHSLTTEVGIGSRSHDLVGEDFRILRMSPGLESYPLRIWI